MTILKFEYSIDCDFYLNSYSETSKERVLETLLIFAGIIDTFKKKDKSTGSLI